MEVIMTIELCLVTSDGPWLPRRALLLSELIFLSQVHPTNAHVYMNSVW